MEYYAHSPKKSFPAQTYKDHVLNVLRLANKYAQDTSLYCPQDGEAMVKFVEAASFWHDLGKLDADNQIVLSGKKKAKILPKKHWDAGVALLEKHNPYPSVAVYSHHTGYPDFIDEYIREDNAFRVEKQLNETNELLNGLINIHYHLLGTKDINMQYISPKGNKSIFLRILLSCLADADHTDTAEHYGDKHSTKTQTNLRPAERLEKLNNYVTNLEVSQGESEQRTSLRREMYTNCRDAEIANADRISSCDSPVGTGKTTAIMAHLLTQTQKRGLRRIFVVLPFTNIIQQSVDVYRKALTLPGENPEDVVAELHHRADFENEDLRRYTSFWKAPIIVSTAMAFFETLASNSPAALRRLHELPGSAIFIDEAHAVLPAKLLPIAWQWMNVFAEEWCCYWILASGSLSRFWKIPEVAQDTKTRNVPELVSESLKQRLSAYESTRVLFRNDLCPKTIDSLIEWIGKFPGPSLVIVNTVNNAAILASEYNKRFGRGSVEHLSTALIPIDRDKTLLRVKERLADNNDNNWVLIATSCVEAGVNLSFRTGFRELSSLASLLQVSGRINREGKNNYAELWAFILADSPVINKNPALNDAANVLRSYFLRDEVISQELCTKAISDEIRLGGINKIFTELLEAESHLGFKTVDSLFNVIEADTRFVIVDPDIAARIKSGDINWRELQKNSVQIWGYKLHELRLPEILKGVFQWNLGYDDFLGYMAGILKMYDPKSYIV